MRTFLRALATLLASLSISAIAFLPGTAAPAASGWPQAQSDLPADPTITFGTLPNGMRYLVKPNASPPGAVSLRFIVDVGSLEEADDQAGIAHLLEHMVFRGSKHFADGEALKTLQGVGVSRGADFNASTGYSQTGFRFDLPKNDGASLDKALLVFRDIASDALLDSKALDSERAVVLAEVRQRDVVQTREWRARMSAAVGPAFTRALDPAGKQDVLQAATADQLRTFYRAWYRPERATLLVVGDVDPKTVAQKIDTLFSDWRASSPSPVAPAVGPVALSGPQFATFTEPNVENGVTLAWTTAHDTTPDTKAHERNELLQILGLGVLNRRLANELETPDCPYLGAGGVFLRAPTHDVTMVSATSRPGRAADTLRALHATYAGLLRDSVRPGELDLAIQTARAQLQTAATSAPSMQSAALAGQFMGSLYLDDVIVTPQVQLDLFETIVKTLTPDEVTASLRSLLTERGPAVFVSGPVPVEGGEKALAAALTAPPRAVAPALSATSSTWPYTNFGPAGTVVSRTEVPDLGLTQLVFANGIRANVKPTKFRAGQIIVSVYFGKGRLGLPKDSKTPIWALPQTLVWGGLARVDAHAMMDIGADKIARVALGIGDNAFIMQGATRSEDFQFQLQLLAAQLTDPAWRPEGFQRDKDAVLISLTQAAASPSGVLSLHLGETAHAGDPRWQAPTAQEVQSAQLEDVKALFGKALTDGSPEVTVVGDVTVDDAIKGLQATFGALPGRFAPPVPFVGDERLPAPGSRPIVLTHKGDPSRALAAIAWPTLGFPADQQMPRTLRVLELILAQRAFDTLRTQAGMTYSPVTQTFSSEATPTFGYLGIAAEIPLVRIHDFYSAVAQMTADLRSREVTSDELARIRDARVQDLVRIHQTNEYWAGNLSGSQGDPRKLDNIRSTNPDMERVTPADVLRAAKTYLSDDKSWKVVIVPEGQSGSVLTMR